VQILYSWEVLGPAALKPAGGVTSAFLATGIKDFRAAAAYMNALPYGRNANRSDILGVIHERRGTCSTKHALLCRLALEQGLEIALLIGIYEMNARNTPGIGSVLERHGLDSLPEAHCFLRSGEMRIDVTRTLKIQPSEEITHFTYEEVIKPDQIGDYKVALHRRFLRQWLKETALRVEYCLDEVWHIREECIAALAERGAGAG
jgi:hypothetical protein